MSASTVFNFLRENCNLKGNDEAIKNSLQDMDADSWFAGYQERLKQQRKQKILAKVRREAFIKKFLDYISDLTHGAKKKV